MASAKVCASGFGCYTMDGCAVGFLAADDFIVAGDDDVVVGVDDAGADDADVVVDDDSGAGVYCAGYVVFF